MMQKLSYFSFFASLPGVEKKKKKKAITQKKELAKPD